MKQLFLSTALFLSTYGLVAQNGTDSTITVTDTTKKTAMVDSSDLYGFISARPIKVGSATGGGPAKQRQYLESLRDARGNSVTYERMGSCCAYASPNGLMGYALIDKYQVTYYDAENKKQKLVLYISFYDYEKPRPVKGFTFAD